MSEETKPPTTCDFEATKDGKLSLSQIENWRRVLFDQIGQYALIMPADEIQRIRDKIQTENKSV